MVVSRRFVSTVTTLALALACLASGRGSRGMGTTELVSVGSAGVQGADESRDPCVSIGGRYVAFSSFSANLVPNDRNGLADIFVRDRLIGQTTRASISSNGTEAEYGSGGPSISSDGRYVAFYSLAGNLVVDDTNQLMDAFVHDRVLEHTSRVSVSSSGAQASAATYYTVISADGCCVAFSTTASNLVPGDTNGYLDVFVHDRTTRETTRVSVSSDGAQANSASTHPSISADGRYVSFRSLAQNLVPDDTNGFDDVFVHDRVTGQTTRVSVSSSGTQGNDNSVESSISADGRYIAFQSLAYNLAVGSAAAWDIFVHDRLTGRTVQASVASDGALGNGSSTSPSISADGRFVAFESMARNLVPNDYNGQFDAFVYDCLSGRTTLVSVASSGALGNGGSSNVSLSADGRFTAFESGASNLVAEDNNGRTDVFLHDGIIGSDAKLIYLPLVLR